jgi:Spy/CpxP family protein refolding chaperone
MTNYRLPNIHRQEAEQASSNFEKAADVLCSLVLTPEQIQKMNEQLAVRRAEFIERARNLKQAKRSQRSEE